MSSRGVLREDCEWPYRSLLHTDSSSCGGRVSRPREHVCLYDHDDVCAAMTTNRLYKVIIIGDATVGKTSFMQRYVWDMYPKNYKATIGVDFYIKIVKWSDTMNIKLQLWDIAGQERFTSMTRVYYKDASACIIMFDITNRKSFGNVVQWKRDLDVKCTLPDGNPIPCILLANKSDLGSSRHVEQAEVETLCRDLEFLGWNETSTKNRTRVDQSMNFMLEELMKIRTTNTSHDNQKNIRLRYTSSDVENEDKCIC